MASASERLRDLVKERLALDLSRRQQEWFEQMLEELARAQALPAAVLLERLREESLTGSAWLTLIDRLTIAETYFFRDPGQMELLRDTLLPGLMREAHGRRLRIWSAGCSTGEELYSVAMLLESLGGPSADLLGTDINASVIEQASRGIYRERSLRRLPTALKAAYLQQCGGEFRIHERLRRQTAFSVESLFEEQSKQLRGLDLIICRNVLIYFERERLPALVERFHRALRPGGILLTGHGEILTVKTPFELLPFPQSLVYRRPDVLARRTAELPRSLKAAPPRGDSRTRSRAPEPASSENRANLDPWDLCLQARRARLQGQSKLAQRLLWQALYLAPDLAEVYLELGLLVVGQDPDRARKHRATALELLGKEAPRGSLAESLRELERALP